MLDWRIRKQSALEEAQEPHPEAKGRYITGLKLIERVGTTEVGIKVFEDIGG
jgi:hypothetical protein